MNRGARWFRSYIALAAFNLLTISCSLFLNHRLMNSQADSTRVNQEWAERLDRFSQLAELGGAVNAPGNDVFDSQDVAGESARLAAALATFEKALAGAEAALAVRVPVASARLLGQNLRLVSGLMKEMTDEAEMIFSFFRQRQPDKAGKRMATMDRKFALLTAGFAQLASHVRQIQKENFIEQHFQAAALRRYEQVLAAAVILMVLVFSIYGHRMARAMHQADEDLRLEVAERRRSEHSVLESKRFLQSTLDALSAHIAILDESGVIVSVNAAWDRFARDNEHAVTGLGAGGNYLEVCDQSRGECAEQAPAVARGIRAVLAGELEEFRLEYPCHSPKEKRWFIVRVTRFGGESARRIVIANENITERKQAEEQSLRAQAFLNSVVENLPIGVFIKNADNRRLVLWNKANEVIHGLSAAELLGKNDFDLFSKAEAERFTAMDTAALRQRGIVEVPAEIVHTRHQGERMLHTQKLPIFGPDGEPAYLLGISEDVTERRQAEMERLRLVDFLEASLNEVYVFDSQSLRFSYVNRSARENLGYTAGQLKNLTPLDLKPEFTEETFRKAISPLLNGAVPKHLFQTIHRRVDGTDYPVEVCLQLVASGTERVFLAVINDISERKRAEAELAKAQRELLDTSRQAGMAEIATGVLHNVGNVLNSVNVSANLVSDQVRKAPVADLGRVVALLREQGANLGAFFTSDPRGPKVADFLAQLADKFTRQQESQLTEVASLQKNIEHIKDIVAMQQSYAKVSGLTESLSPVDLIEDALRMNAGSFQKHEVNLVREMAADLPRVCVDKHKVLQILVNLLRNAKHACDDAGRPDKRITVRGTREEGRVRITITDNGVGIPPENLTRIFNHGFTTKKEGHGFGLHSAANAVKEMGGGLTVHSDGAGHGAAFTLELPIAPVQRKEAA